MKRKLYYTDEQHKILVELVDETINNSYDKDVAINDFLRTEVKEVGDTPLTLRVENLYPNVDRSTLKNLTEDILRAYVYVNIDGDDLLNVIFGQLGEDCNVEIEHLSEMQRIHTNVIKLTGNEKVYRLYSGPKEINVILCSECGAAIDHRATICGVCHLEIIQKGESK